jgi:tetratricopeptide (TPR) repeat protein
MAKIALRPYLIEITDMIDHGQFEEAIAHCRHILERFPKHIETYRILGKAYLEAQQYGDATDILQRVLSSIPGDFVANIGLSIIREDEGNIDASIWHMERSFESQPAHQAVQEELRRLYGQRDGIEPKKIRMTRGALATMYATGDLYEQAIAELLAALKDEPKRTDLQVLLAKMYFESEKYQEAFKICNEILIKLPHNLVATKILVKTSEMNSSLEIPDDTKARWIELDPYVKYLPEKEYNPEKVPDSQVVLSKLEFMPGGFIGGTTSTISDNISSSDTKEEVNMPDWMGNTQELRETSDFNFSPEDDEGLLDDDNESSMRFSEEDLAIPIGGTAALLRDSSENWLPDNNENESAKTENDEIPTWLTDSSEIESLEETSETLIGNDDDTIISKNIDSPSPKEKDHPKWVDELKWDENPVENKIQQQEGTEMDNDNQKNNEEIPDWLKNLGSDENASESPDSPEATDEDASMAWLEGLTAKAGADEEEMITSPEDKLNETSDWFTEGDTTPILEETFEDIPKPSVSQTSIPSEVIPEFSMEEDSGITWLEGLASNKGVDEEELITSSEDRTDEVPDWLAELVDADQDSESEPLPELNFEGKAESLEEIISPKIIENAFPQTTPDDEELTKNDSLFEAPTPNPPSDEEANTQGSAVETDWLSNLESISTDEVSEIVEDVPDWLASLSEEDTSTEPESIDEINLPSSDPVIQPFIDNAVEIENDKTNPASLNPVMAEDVDNPDWLDELLGEDSNTAMGITADEMGLDDIFTHEKISDTSTEDDDTQDWLSALSGDATDPIKQESEPAEQHSPTTESNLEESWLTDLVDNPPDVIIEPELPSESDLLPEEISEEKEEVPDWLASLVDDSETTEEGRKPKLESNQEGIGWLDDLLNEPEEDTLIMTIDDIEITPEENPEPESEDLSKSSEMFSGEAPSMDIPEADASAEESDSAPLPDWLNDVIEETPPTATPDWAPAVIDGTIAKQENTPNDLEKLIEEISEEIPEPLDVPDVNDVPDWIIDKPIQEIIEPAPSEMEESPKEEFFPKPDPKEFFIVDETPTSENISKPVKTRKIKPPEDISAQLQEAKNLLKKNKLSEALKLYKKLIRKGKNINELLSDIKKALKKYPLNVELWQTLGDIYMRDDRLQDAMDSYTRAEDLLR